MQVNSLYLRKTLNHSTPCCNGTLIRHKINTKNCLLKADNLLKPILWSFLLSPGHFLTDKQTCMSRCPTGTFANKTSGRCEECSKGCVMCQDGGQCQRCRSGLHLQKGECVVECERCLPLPPRPAYKPAPSTQILQLPIPFLEGFLWLACASLASQSAHPARGMTRTV